MRRQGVWRAGALAVVLLGGLVGCGLGPGTVDEAMWSSVPCVTDGESPRTSGYELVPTDLLPYAREERTVVDLTAPEPTTDDDGVLQVTWKDHDGPVYHPVNTGRLPTPRRCWRGPRATPTGRCGSPTGSTTSSTRTATS